jgi:4-amino-4-deoxy-L-arabinose transferase-like glycosyltransferase
VNNAHKLLIAILLAAFGVRAATGLLLQNWLDEKPDQTFLIEGDAYGYWELGRRLAAGDPYEVHLPPRKVLRMPGFPALLAMPIRLAKWLDMPERSILFARLLLAVVGAIACGLVYWLGKELCDQTTGLIGAAIAASLPTLIGFSVVVLSETLFAGCLTASLILMVKLTATGFDKSARMRSVSLSLAVGVSVAVACYVRPSWLLTGVIFAVIPVGFTVYRKQALLRGALILVGLFLALLPWAIRNQRATGHFVLTTLWVGPSLYDGLNPNATGDSNMEFIRSDRLVGNVSEYELDRHYRRKAWQYAFDHPGHVLRLAAAKLGRFWKPLPNAEQFTSFWLRVAVLLSFGPLCLFAAWGWWVSRHEPMTWLFTVGPILYFSAIHMVFVSSLRYRLPAEYPLCVLAAVGLRSCFLAASGWRKRSAVPERVGEQ